jgi:ionotropic glutamate receptor
MALAAMSITASRKLVLDFSEPLFRSVGISILMKKPRRKPHFFKFITVLESKVWACIAGAYFFTSLLLAIFEQFSPNGRRPRPIKPHSSLGLTMPASIATRAGLMMPADLAPQSEPAEEEEEEDGEPIREFTFKESLWFCITSLTPQGGGEAPRSLYGRLVAATWWLFGFIVIASYTANLAAFLTVSR